MELDPTDPEYNRLIDILENAEHLIGYVLNNEKVQYDTKYDLDSAFDDIEEALLILRDAEREPADEQDNTPPSDIEALAEDLA